MVARHGRQHEAKRVELRGGVGGAKDLREPGSHRVAEDCGLLRVTGKRHERHPASTSFAYAGEKPNWASKLSRAHWMLPEVICLMWTEGSLLRAVSYQSSGRTSRHEKLVRSTPHGD